MRALVYARVSLDLAEGRSVAEQEAECRSWAGREGWSVDHVITETGSASRYARSTHARTRWPDLVAAISSGQYDILLTWEASRATRQLDEYAQLRQLCATHGVLWGYSGTVYDLTHRGDRFRTGLDALMAEDESARTSERVQRAVRARAAAGRPHGKLPYGYRREYDPTTGALLAQVPDETTAPVVREIYARVVAGDSLYAIARDLDARQVPPPRPPTRRTDRRQQWLPITIRRIATSPTYAGRRIHRGQVVGDATWEGLVDTRTWERSVAVISDPRRLTRTSNSTARHLLSGIARCGRDGCGHELRHIKNRGRWGNYVCMACYGVAITADRLDEYITDVMLALLAEHADQLHAAATHDEVDAELAAARAHEEELRARLRGFAIEAAAGRLSPATMVAIEADLAPQITAAARQVRRLHVPRALQGLDLSDPAAAWPDDVAERRRLIRELLSVTVLPAGKGNRGRRGLDETRVRIDPLW